MSRGGELPGNGQERQGKSAPANPCNPRNPRFNFGKAHWLGLLGHLVGKSRRASVPAPDVFGDETSVDVT